MRTPIVLISGLLLAATPALAQKAHVHGEGSLEAVIENNRLSLRLELPLDVAVGFERAPRNDKEKAALTAAAKALADPALFSPAAAANCIATPTRVNLPAYDGKQAPDHADIEVSLEFICTAPNLLKSVDTSVFRQFKRLYRIEARRIGPAGQGAARLTPKNPILTW